MSRGWLSGSFDFGTSTAPATRATAMTGTFTRNTDPHQKCSSNQPDAMGPMAAPPPEMPAQMAMALGRSWAGKTLVRMDRVEGITNAAATPITARAVMMVAAVVGSRRHRRPDEEQHEPGLERSLAAVAVADRAGGEQQAGEHQRVGVDHPLQRAGGGIELAGQGRDGDVQARVADDDDHQAHAEHGQDGPATLEDGRVDPWFGSVRDGGVHGFLRDTSYATTA